MKAILLPSCRPALMRRFLASFREWPQRADWRIYVAFQGYTDAELEEIRDGNADIITAAWNLKERLAPYVTRSRMYPKMLADGVKVFAGCDDDMEFLGSQTDFNTMAERVQQPGFGVVAGNWARNEAMLPRAIYEPGKFVTQPLVNMAGGQISRREVIEIILRNPIRDYLFCDVQVALLAYGAGYLNQRYLGSLLIHRVMEKNGLKKMFAATSMALPYPPEHCTVTPTERVWYQVGNNWKMPDSGNVTQAAHAAHQTNRKTLLT